MEPLEQERFLRQALVDLIFGGAIFVLFVLLGLLSSDQAVSKPAPQATASKCATSEISQPTILLSPLPEKQICPVGTKVREASSMGRFRLASLDGTKELFIGASVDATDRSPANASELPSRFHAIGEKQLYPGQSAALENRTPGDGYSVRQVVLLTPERSVGAGLGSSQRAAPALPHSLKRGEVFSGRVVSNHRYVRRRIEAYRQNDKTRKLTFIALAIIFAAMSAMTIGFWRHLGRAYTPTDRIPSWREEQ